MSITTSNSAQTIRTFTATGIKLNSTRDSGFSDSIIEDCSQHSSSSTNNTQTLSTSSSTSMIHTSSYYSPVHQSSNNNHDDCQTRTEHVFNIAAHSDDDVNRKGDQQPEVTMSTKCFANKGLDKLFI